MQRFLLFKSNHHRVKLIGLHLWRILREIRVDSMNELKERISQYINHVNEKPVLFMWRYKMEERDEMPGGITV